MVVLPDGNAVEAPWVAACGACRSPWIIEIDRGLASGLSLTALRGELRNRHPACPNEQILREHIDHLPVAQREMRRNLEDAGRTIVGVDEAVREVITRGFRQLAEGTMEISASDWMRALALQDKINAADQRVASAEAWQQAFLAFFEIARRHMSPAEWHSFRSECSVSPEILAVSSPAVPMIRQAS